MYIIYERLVCYEILDADVRFFYGNKWYIFHCNANRLWSYCSYQNHCRIWTWYFSFCHALLYRRDSISTVQRKTDLPVDSIHYSRNSSFFCYFDGNNKSCLRLGAGYASKSCFGNNHSSVKYTCFCISYIFSY
uniref:(northern house mosquito) hypothetical protein n=1 Tax=Culex pipiens TaxID=7175 RepID=A0A8D8BC52_CULPI